MDHREDMFEVRNRRGVCTLVTRAFNTTLRSLCRQWFDDCSGFAPWLSGLYLTLGIDVPVQNNGHLLKSKYQDCSSMR